MPINAKKSNVNPVSAHRQKLTAAVQIEFSKRLAHLADDKDEQRAARLADITRILNLSRPCESITDLTDKQLGLLLDDLRAGQTSPSSTVKNPKNRFAARPRAVVTEPLPVGGAEIIHLASKEQVFTLEKIVGFIGWKDEQRDEFLLKRYRNAKFAMLTHGKANSAINILLRIAAQKDLKALGKTTCTTAEINAHINVIKSKLTIDRRN